ncbi:hypothetical protein Ddye_023772 [Dipteronia dyeriana]|uniref:DDE Tnp4 domain-containing protein n=1 Tax=Dipteronia dyeriana TaxID=168575 RepID=A0AAD9TTM3_9ROSI|nr:hypothetical protein Ddye_023772 [Dipteronia dyeriana]
MFAKPGSLPSKLRESIRIYPYFKDCIEGIDGTPIPAMITGRNVSSYRNRHGTISQNVLAACNFDLEFIYVLNGWEGSVHDSKLLTYALTRRRTALKVTQVDPELVDEVDPEPVFQMQEQQRTEANEWRHAIALIMWTDARHNDNNENQ